MTPSDSTRDTARRLFVRAVDLGLVLLSLAAAAATVQDAPGWVGRHGAITATVALLGSIALWWRRRWPLWIVAIGIVVFLVTHDPIPLVVGLYTLAVVRRDLVLVGATTLAAVAFSLPDLIAHPDWGWSTAVVGAALALFPTVVGAYVGARRDLIASLRERADRAEAERELRASQARIGERTRIAREMHDVLAHQVSLIALHAGALEVNAGAGPERVGETAALIRQTARHALEDLREVLGVLRSDDDDDDGGGGEPPELQPAPRASDIARLVESSQAAGLPVDLDGPIPDLPDGTARAAYRLVQEGLTNVHKHAGGATAVVTVRGDAASGVTVAVTNGRPVGASARGAPLPGAGAGLVGLGERVRLLGGTLRSGIEPDGGWRLEGWLPWSSAVPDVASEEQDAPVRTP